MLSRVAAVKAPRTHNRRRVTRSSGRRKEGRESEPQRSNMSRHLFYSAVLLVVMCCGTAAVNAEELSEPNFEWKGITDGVTVESLGVPGLLKVGSDVFAVAEAQCKNGEGEDNTFTGIASQIITKEVAKKLEEVLKETKDKTQFLEEVASSSSRKKVDVSRPTAVVKERDIYMLVGKYSRNAAAAGQDGGADGWGLLLVKGEVSDAGESKKIDWKDTKRPQWKTLGGTNDPLTELIGGGGSGVKLPDDTLLFPVEATKNDKKTKIFLLVIDPRDIPNWTLSEMSADDCSDPSVVEWKDKLMMMTACDDGRRRVYEIGDKGESWTEALGTLSRVWGNKHDEKLNLVRGGFSTAKIEGRDVMLVTLPVYSNEKGKKKSELRLWLTDNTHIVDIGPVSREDEDVAASSLLHKSGDDNNEELIALYEKKKDGEKPGMVSVLLTEQLQRVKEVLATWKKVDDLVSKLCPSENDVESALPENACRTAMPADGLVGFLSGNFSDGTWRDEYLGVNATVKGHDSVAEMTDNGVKFRGAWAEWPVGKQGENQLYHFANYNFTLVATVSVDGVPKEGTTVPLMSVKTSGDGNPVLLGLSYDNEKKWILKCGGGTTKELKSTSETERTRHVVILLKSGGQGSAYVDGQRVGGNEECALGEAASKGISHFYIGGDGGDKGDSASQEVHVSVKNVLLYNRPLDGTEVVAFNQNKAPIPSPADTPIEGGMIQSSGGGQEEPRRLSGSSVAGGLGVSTSAVSSATTSSGKEGPVNQLASVKSSDGTQNLGGASSPDGDPAVGTGARNTVQGDGSPQTPVGTPDAADKKAPNAEAMGQDGTAVDPGASAGSGEHEELTGGTDGQEEEGTQPQVREVNATALSSNVGNLSQGNDSDACTMRESGLLPLLPLLGLWGFAAA
ncbi:trans-sialidase [Trypanosoma cruzi cruzi]|uniref:Putative trans-sialidase, Group V n=1 Tax=Trypanosoma cruzi TaxID=5693 RepID=A0A2V2V704_TRYCR|nr:trans-sialidase [Trypanosoma cruzi cruzi]PWU90103.1 putative trans-sialidase, Group V [Trypanosoma cruzi]